MTWQHKFVFLTGLHWKYWPNVTEMCSTTACRQQVANVWPRNDLINLILPPHHYRPPLPTGTTEVDPFFILFSLFILEWLKSFLLHSGCTPYCHMYSLINDYTLTPIPPVCDWTATGKCVLRCIFGLIT